MNYFIRSQGNVYGPYDSNVMLGFVREGRVVTNTEVSTDKLNWTYAGHVPELFPPAVPQAPAAPTAASYGMGQSAFGMGQTAQSADPYGLTPMSGDPYGMQPIGQSDYGMAPISPVQASPAAAPQHGPSQTSPGAYGTAPVAPAASSYGGGTDWDNVLSEKVASGVPKYDVPATTSNPYSPPKGYGVPNRRKTSSGEGSTIVTLGIVSIVFSCTLIGLIAGIIGLNKANEALRYGDDPTVRKGKTLCTIGLVLVLVWFLLGIVIGIVRALVDAGAN